jgi:hypothetical protein
MVELRKYFQRLQDKIGETKSADGIVEGPWETVVRELNQMSLECARELEKEIGPYPKGGPAHPEITQPCEQSPPIRLLALNLILDYWLGFIMTEKNAEGKPVFTSKRIQEAYNAGKNLSEKKEVS